MPPQVKYCSETSQSSWHSWKYMDNYFQLLSFPCQSGYPQRQREKKKNLTFSAPWEVLGVSSFSFTSSQALILPSSWCSGTTCSGITPAPSQRFGLFIMSSYLNTCPLWWNILAERFGPTGEALEGRKRHRGDFSGDWRRAAQDVHCHHHSVSPDCHEAASHARPLQTDAIREAVGKPSFFLFSIFFFMKK